MQCHAINAMPCHAMRLSFYCDNNIDALPIVSKLPTHYRNSFRTVSSFSGTKTNHTVRIASHRTAPCGRANNAGCGTCVLSRVDPYRTTTRWRRIESNRIETNPIQADRKQRNATHCIASHHGFVPVCLSFDGCHARYVCTYVVRGRTASRSLSGTTTTTRERVNPIQSNPIESNRIEPKQSDCFGKLQYYYTSLHVLTYY
mmetsp:Transcript_19304/g.40549  ORF Transcript_19304/g.40549 Transcript_19304/m.40549 type:complete len:201 (+) Transcript_19304:441-1043(+)